MILKPPAATYDSIFGIIASIFFGEYDVRVAQITHYQQALGNIYQAQGDGGSSLLCSFFLKCLVLFFECCSDGPFVVATLKLL